MKKEKNRLISPSICLFNLLICFPRVGIPVGVVALYIIITHALYDWDITEIYADVHNNGDM